MVEPSRTNVQGCTQRSKALAVDGPAPDGGQTSVTEHPVAGPTTGFPMLAQSLVHCPPGSRARRGTGQAEEVLFVLCGEGSLHLNGSSHALEAESGAYLAPGEEYELETAGDGPMRLVRVIVPDPEPPGPAASRAVVRRLSDQEAQEATTQREFRIVADPQSGLRSATHFVGFVPSAKAPDHFHTYDEVIYIIDGQGELQAEGAHHSVQPGSSIQLPARTIHCLQNTGRELMRLVAVFRPSGSPAAAYYPDGTPAYPGAPPIHSIQDPPKEEGHS
ncbi:MAG TPA: cupin domain-containing protein [Solirubrobacteraceae bacterium]